MKPTMITVPAPDVRDASWRKPKRSISNGACLEVADFPAGVYVRDTKQDRQPDRTVLAFPATAWAAFTSALKGER